MSKNCARPRSPRNDFLVENASARSSSSSSRDSPSVRLGSYKKPGSSPCGHAVDQIMSTRQMHAGGCGLILALAAALVCRPSYGQQNLLANPGFEKPWPAVSLPIGPPRPRKVGKTLFVDREQPHAGRACLRLRGTPHTWTTCSAKAIPVRPNTDYWISWWFKARNSRIPVARTCFCKPARHSESSRTPTATVAATGRRTSLATALGRASNGSPPCCACKHTTIRPAIPGGTTWACGRSCRRSSRRFIARPSVG